MDAPQPRPAAGTDREASGGRPIRSERGKNVKSASLPAVNTGGGRQWTPPVLIRG
jgi:hypothetical protein